MNKLLNLQLKVPKRHLPVVSPQEYMVVKGFSWFNIIRSCKDAITVMDG